MRHFDLPWLRTTFSTNDEKEAAEAIALGAVEIPDDVRETLRATYDAGHLTSALEQTK